MSGASGSTYTMGWLFHQLHLDQSATISDVVLDAGRFEELTQRVESKWGRRASLYVAALQSLAGGLRTDLTTPLVPVEGRGEPTLDPLRLKYEEMIREVFISGDRKFSLADLSRIISAGQSVETGGQRVPGAGADVQEVVIPARVGSPPKLVAHFISYSRKRSEVEANAPRAPMPIFLTAAGYTDPEKRLRAFDCDNPDTLAMSAFEFTPFRVGSEEYGFSGVGHNSREPGTAAGGLATVIAISGAALDHPCSKFRTFIDILFGRLGASVPERLVGPVILDVRSDALLQPKDGSSIMRLRQNNLTQFPATRPLQLSDGGIVDNLAVFPLIRRHCDTIIVIDGAYDPHLVFDDLQKLRRHLNREYGLAVNLGNVDEIAAVTRDPTSSEPAPKCNEREPQQSLCYLSRRLDTAVFEGTIEAVPVLAPDGEGRPKKVRLLYAKLSVDAKAKALPREVLDHLIACRGNGPTSECQFPHDPTERQDFSKEKWRAYVTLGQHVSETCLGSNLALRRECSSTEASRRDLRPL